MSWRWYTWKSQILETGSNNVIEISSSKQFFFKKVGKLFLDLEILCNPLSINRGWFWESRWSENSIFEILIKSLRVFLYLLEIATILDFFSTFPIACLNTCFWKIMIIWFWYGRGLLAQVFSRQVYAPIKQTFSIGNIIHQLFTY